MCPVRCVCEIHSAARRRCRRKRSGSRDRVVNDSVGIKAAQSLAELDTVGFNLYVDDQRGRLNGVACSAGATPTTFLCQAPLPFA